ncbi:MAG: SH3 domain-containing protein [Clostridia bacterium]|nr:SH3 domain-containing protein [Clostridia bacterium]
MKKIISFMLSAVVVLTIVFTFGVNSSAADEAYAGRVATSSGNLNVRSAPSSSSSVITSIKKSSWVTLTGKSGSWWRVEYANGKYGWCHSDYIKKQENSYGVTVNITSGKLNVRKGAGMSYDVKAKLNKGEDAVVIKYGASWSRILYRGNKTGYVSTSYIRKVTSQGAYSAISLSVPSFKQTDSRWSSYPLGTTGGTIGTIGCTTTALAMTESFHTGKTVTPKAMAQKLSYSASGSLYWPSTYSTEMAGSDYLSRIYKLLSEGKPVVFGAKKSNGTQHWVTVTGYNGSTQTLAGKGFTVNDPGSNTRTTLSDFLSAYPNVYKIVYRK